eukprot:3119179-Pyramimonas_sp.AAC.1
MAIGLEFLVSEDSATNDENAPRLIFAVVPPRLIGSGVCSRSPIGSRGGESSLDKSITSPLLLPRGTRRATEEEGRRPLPGPPSC